MSSVLHILLCGRPLINAEREDVSPIVCKLTPPRPPQRRQTVRVGNKYNLIALRFEIELLRTLYHHEVVVDLNGFDLDFIDNSLNYQGPAK